MKMKPSIRKQAVGLVLGVSMLAVSVLSLSTPSAAQFGVGIGVGISVRIGPPALPVYAQPVCPGPGYLWTPGYWAWSDDDGYYWVPGTWVVAPVGMLWTPGYWGFAGGLYGWHAGYWGPHVGFYGGINYGFGYGGAGFFGGEWRGGAFFYNRSVVNVNVTNVTNVYNRTVIVNNVHTSFNGPGGVGARPSREEEAYAREPHTEALAARREHEHAASQNRQLFASENHGRPAIAATGKPGEFSGPHVQRASAAGAEYHASKISPREARASAGDRGFKVPARNEPARNQPSKNEATRSGEHFNSHPMTHPDNRPTGNNQARSNEMRKSEGGNRPPKASPQTPKPAQQERQVQKRPQPSRPEPKPAKAEPKHQGRP